MPEMSNDTKEKIMQHLLGGEKFDELTTGLKCRVRINFIKNRKFNIVIEDLHGNILKDFHEFSLMEGDSIQIDGLGHHIMLDDGGDIPPVLDPKDFETPLKTIQPKATLKRKMDIDG